VFIKHLALRKFRGFSFDLEFSSHTCALIAPNGGGKTTVLDVLAATSGVDDAIDLVDDCDLDSLELTVIHEGKEHVLTLDDGWDYDKIAEFKAGLPVRTSYVLRADLLDDRYVGERDDYETNFEEMSRWMIGADIPIKAEWMYASRETGRYDMMVGDSGAKFQYLNIGMRIPPNGIPMLVVYPELSLHIHARRHVTEFYKRSSDHQLIFATHCPTVFSSFVINETPETGHLDLFNQRNIK